MAAQPPPRSLHLTMPCIYLTLVMAVLLALAPAWGRTDVPPDSGPPTRDQIMRTQVGKQLDWVLRSINERAVTETEGRFTPRFLEQFTIEEVRKRLSTLRDEAFKGETVTLVRHEVDPRPDAMSCIIGNEEADRFLSLILSVNEETGQIAGMLFAIAGGAGGEGGAQWDALEGNLGKIQGGVWFGAYQVLIDNPGTIRADASVDPVYEFGWRKWLNISHVSRAWVFGTVATLLADGRVHLTDELKQADGQMFSLADAMAKSAAGIATATDALLRFAGRSDVERYLRLCTERPEKSLPFLTQRENALLKSPGNKELLTAYAAGDEDERLDILSEKGRLQRALEDTAGATDWKEPSEVGRVGWFASNREAAYALAKLHAFGQRPGMDSFARAWKAQTPKIRVEGVEREAISFDPTIWTNVAFLGGSEPGVASLAWLLTRDDGKVYALVMTWNNVERPLEDEKLYELAKKGVEILERDGKPGKIPGDMINTPDGDK